MELRYAKTLTEAQTARDQGYEPVECSFDSISVTGPLQLDHHGALAHNPPVSLQAFQLAQQQHFQPLERFVVTGQPDADAIYALLVLSGQIHPCEAIANAIATLDNDPVGIDQKQVPYLRVPAFRRAFTPRYNLDSFLEAIEVGKRAFDPAPLTDREALQAQYFEQHRFRAALQAKQQIVHDVAFVVSDQDSRDIGHDFFASLVVQYKPTSGVITFSGCTQAAINRLQARPFRSRTRISVYQLLGEQGLYAFFPKLDALLGPGSGGRATIGGSPRGNSYSYQQAFQAYQLLCNHISSRSSPAKVPA